MSIDQHTGQGPTKRGDLESLGYCIMHVVCCILPWKVESSDDTILHINKVVFEKD